MLSQVSQQSLHLQQIVHCCPHCLDQTPLAWSASVGHVFFSQTQATSMLLHSEHLSCLGRDPMTLLSPGAAPVMSPVFPHPLPVLDSWLPLPLFPLTKHSY